MDRREFVKLSATALALLACNRPEERKLVRKAEGPRVFQRSLGEPEYLDPGLCSESEGGTVIQDAFEGLYQYGASHKVWPPGVAERHDLSEDGITYTFYLRRDAKWSDGVGVTAHDFEWSWKRVLDPVTASRYASILWFLEGGREYNEAPADQAPALREKVGVKALDDYTLQVRLVGPTPFFLQLTAFYSYAPVPRHVIEKHGDRWARPENIVSNGPFRVTEWQQNQRIVAVANPHYWDRASIPFDKVVFKITQEDDPAHNMFLAGETDYLDSKVPPSALPKYLREKEPLLSTTPYLGVYFYLINIKSPPFDDVRVRRALNLAIQKSSIGKYVIKGGQQEAWSIVHPGLEDLGYTKAQGDTFDPDKARELLAEAGYPDGKGFPRFQISYNTLEGHKLVAQFIQQEWKKYLGISCDLDNMEWKVLLKKQHEKDFQITRFAWIGDYLDPLTFLELFEGANPNNRCNFDDPEFNDLIHGSVREADPVKRFAMLKRAEAILCEQLPAIPIYYYVKQDMMHEWVEGYEHHLQGVHATRWFRVKGSRVLRYVLRRIVSAVLVLFVVITASFFVMRAAPGGPFDGEKKLPEEIEKNIRAKYHLDKPLWAQYALQMESILLHADFGPSMKYPDKTVNEILADGLPVSMILGLQALFFALLLGLPTGLYAGFKQNRWQDYTTMTGAMAGVSIPNFVLGPLLVYIFSLNLQWFDAANWNGLEKGLLGHFQSSVLPSLSLGMYYAAYIARLSRGGMLEVVRQDYVRTARAKGLSERVIITRHTLKGAVMPVVSYLGPAFAGMLTGSVVIERIFNIPGLGTHFVASAFNRDYPLVLGTIVLYSALLVVLNLVVDILYTLLDPRVSYD